MRGTLTIKPVLDMKVKGVGKLGRHVKITPHVDKDAGVYVTNIPEDRVEYLSKALGFDVKNDTYYQHKEQDWDRSDLILKIDKTEINLDLSNPINEIKYYLYSNHPDVAPSLEKLQSGEYPGALAVVFNKDLNKATKSKNILRIRKLNSSVADMSISQKIDLLVYTRDSLYSDSSPDDIEIALDNLIRKSPAKIEQYIANKKSKPIETSLKVKVKVGLIKNILTKDGPEILFEGFKLGDSISEVIQYLIDPNNQSEKAKLYKLLNATHLIPDQKAKRSKRNSK